MIHFEEQLIDGEWFITLKYDNESAQEINEYRNQNKYLFFIPTLDGNLMIKGEKFEQFQEVRKVLKSMQNKYFKSYNERYSSSKNFSGDLAQFKQCQQFLREQGFAVNDATHVGNNHFEFTESEQEKEGCNDIYKIQARIEGGKVLYRTVVVGFYCNDNC